MSSLRIGRHKDIPPEYYGTPKEVWGFHVPRARGTPLGIGRRFIADNERLFGLTSIRGRIAHTKTLQSLGATHVIFQQRHLGLRIHRAYITVHIGRDGRVYMAKNRAVPSALLPDEKRFDITRTRARNIALRALRKTHFALHQVGGVEPLWYPRRRDLRPAYKVRLFSTKPRSDWIVYVDAERKRVIQKIDNLAELHRFATVFDPNPVVALGSRWKVLRGPGRGLRPPPPAAVSVVELTGLDTSGFLDGQRVTTRPTPGRVRRKDGRFLCPPSDPAFSESMAYFHVTRAMGYLEEIGFRDACRVPFERPFKVNVRATTEDNSFYNPGLKQLEFGTGGVDDAHDAEVILHEFGHAIQDAICPDFGQKPEGWAMGEGFGDYFAASFFADKKPPRQRPEIMAYDGFRNSKRSPPFERRVDSRRTFPSYRATADEHDNGLIWSATLWDIRTSLGREVADRIIVESHFQLDGFAGFAHALRSILDADRNLYDGEHLRTLRRIFSRRKFAPP